MGNFPIGAVVPLPGLLTPRIVGKISTRLDRAHLKYKMIGGRND
jgi:hypothetical protein